MARASPSPTPQQYWTRTVEFSKSIYQPTQQRWRPRALFKAQRFQRSILNKTPFTLQMASTRTHSSSAKRVSLTQEQRANCGSTSGGHASLVSFARSASSRAPCSAEFGSPSHIGATPPGASQVTPPSNAVTDFERASASASEAEFKRNPQSLPRKRQHPSVPKRMREPVTVDALTGMLYELPCPSADSTQQPLQEHLLSEQIARLEVQKRRRQCDASPINNSQQEKEGGQEGVDNNDDMTDDLCFLVDQVAIEESERETKFMPYCL